MRLTEHIRDRRYKRWDKNQFSMPHSSSWLVNPDWVCIPLAVALTPKGLNQTGGYFKLWLSLRRADWIPGFGEEMCHCQTEEEPLCSDSCWESRCHSEALWCKAHGRMNYHQHQEDDAHLKHASKTAIRNGGIPISDMHYMHNVYILQLTKFCPSRKDIYAPKQ